MKWIKASEVKSPHYESVCCRIIGEGFWFTAYWDNSKNMYCPRNASGLMFHEPDTIEWLDESLPSGGKSAEDIEQWYHQWMNDRGKRRVAPGEALTLLKDFASQYAHQQPVHGYSKLINSCNRMIDAFNNAPKEWIQTQDVIDAETDMRTALSILTTTQQPVNDGWVRAEVLPLEYMRGYNQGINDAVLQSVTTT